MEQKIREVLAESKPECMSYNGDNLCGDLGIDSHDIFNVVMNLETAFEIEIEPIYMRMENFMSIGKIEAMIREIQQKA